MFTTRKVDRAATEILETCSKYIQEAARRFEEDRAGKEGERRSVLEKLLESGALETVRELGLDMYNFYHRQGLGLSWARRGQYFYILVECWVAQRLTT